MGSIITINGNITETLYHQGDGNSGSESPGTLAGRPYKILIKDGAGVVRSQKDLTYAPDADGIVPHFRPLQQEDRWDCDAVNVCKQVRVIYTYDHTYGNLILEDQQGDVGNTTDDRRITKTFSQNTTDWIISLPTNETIYEVVGATFTQKALSTFYYDGVTNCDTDSTNQIPTKGNLTRVVRWLSGASTHPSTRMAYDASGNLICTRDANGNLTTITYDTTSTFPKVVTNALNRQTTTQYYGVDGVPADTGLYGQVKTITDPNGQTTTTLYDGFGRKNKVTSPDGAWTEWLYNSFGTVGAQHIQTNSAAGLSTWSYFDGMNRTTTERKTGPDAKIIRMDTAYNNLGQVTSTTLPYFEGSPSNGSTTFTYDAIGRQKQITNSDTSRTLFCYSLWAVGTINANNQMRREVKDAYGRLIEVNEYAGSVTSCSTDNPAIYATTRYQYNVLGSLTNVTDHAGNVTTVGYDSLSRKTSMIDPDMGAWSYKYDPVGNLIEQTDAKAQVKFFTYDAINRILQKDYGTKKALGAGDVRYSYDAVPAGFTSPPSYFQVGRLSQVIDGSGETKFGYDNMGRNIRSDKIVDGVTYTTKTSYDLAGRVKSITYPDNDVVSYDYNGPLLSKAYKDATTSYGQYTEYNALGQPKFMTFGNGVKTEYQYKAANFRLHSSFTT